MLVKLDNVSFGYQSTQVIKEVNLEINQGDFLGMIGPNGGGKSTIIKLIMGLLSPWSGSITRGINPDGSAIKIGYLPQYHDFDKRFPITVEEVILSGLIEPGKRFNSYRKDGKKHCEELINELGLQKFRSKTIGELSGGQMQRVFVGRSLISKPELLILDEPVTYVDNRFEHEMYELLDHINTRTAILLVSHDVGQIVSYVKTIACVNGTVHYHPSNRISQEILASYNCPIDLITHGKVPHRVLHQHS